MHCRAGMCSSLSFQRASRRQHGYRRAREEILPGVGPVEPQRDSTDQYHGVSRDREVAAALRENQASLAEFHRRFVQSGGEGATSLERILAFFWRPA